MSARRKRAISAEEIQFNRQADGQDETNPLLPPQTMYCWGYNDTNHPLNLMSEAGICRQVRENNTCFSEYAKKYMINKSNVSLSQCSLKHEKLCLWTMWSAGTLASGLDKLLKQPPKDPVTSAFRNRNRMTPLRNNCTGKTPSYPQNSDSLVSPKQLPFAQPSNHDL